MTEEKKDGISMSELPERKRNEGKKGKIVRMSDLPSRSEQQAKRRLNEGLLLEPGQRREVNLKNNKKIGEFLKNGCWQGKTCYVVAGGESLKDFDFDRLNKMRQENDDVRIIAINRAYEKLPDADIVYCSDSRFWSWVELEKFGLEVKELFNSFKGMKIFSGVGDVPLPEEIIIADPIGRPGLSANFTEGIGWGNSSGFGALNIAILTGAEEINLLGYDLKGPRWHEGYPEAEGSEKERKEIHKQHLACFLEAAEQFSKVKSNIINRNPKSELKIFEMAELPVWGDEEGGGNEEE